MYDFYKFLKVMSESKNSPETNPMGFIKSRFMSDIILGFGSEYEVGFEFFLDHIQSLVLLMRDFPKAFNYCISNFYSYDNRGFEYTGKLKKDIIFLGMKRRSAPSINIQGEKNEEITGEIYCIDNFNNSQALIRPANDLNTAERNVGLDEFFDFVEIDLDSQYTNKKIKGVYKLIKNIKRPAGFLIFNIDSFDDPNFISMVNKKRSIFKYLTSKNINVDQLDFYKELIIFLNENIPDLYTENLREKIEEILNIYIEETMGPLVEKIEKDKGLN